MKLFINALFGLTALVLSAPLAWAHPHEWIDVRVALIFEDKKLVAVDQSWRFDPFFSSYVLAELNQERPNKQVLAEQASAMGPEMIDNLKKHSFLNEMFYDGSSLSGFVGSFDSAEVIRDQMELRFRLTLLEPLDLKAADFQYRVYDPTYYIEMLHANRHRPKLQGAPWGCRVKVVASEPDEDVLLYASSLDVDESSDEGLGIHLAETATVSC